jgi:superfamily II DNA/RNA helicase
VDKYLTEDFDSLGLSKKVTDAVVSAGYTQPTAIQEQAIPYVLAKRDLIGIAQTGTGKTASFVLPMLTLLEKGRARARMPRTLILEPTRELAAQVFENFEKYGVNHKLNVALLIGGVSFVEQNKILSRGADVLIATPGRLLDHFERGRLLMTGTEIFVIDEADRMLDMGFIPDIERISSLLPPRKQTLFFSATMPEEIRKLSERFLRDPAEVRVDRQATTAETITQILVKTGNKPAEKRQTLRQQIDGAADLTNAIIFCNRKRDIATLSRSLTKHGYDAGPLHGDMDQKSRMQTLATFKAGKLKLLIASDVAARGLDIPDVSHVFNFDVPSHAEDYVHRIGRTGRAGRSGTSITLVAPSDKKYLDAIEKLIQQKLVWADSEGNTPKAPAQAEPSPVQVKPNSAQDQPAPQSVASNKEPRRSGRGRRRGSREDAAHRPAQQADMSASADKSETPKMSEASDKTSTPKPEDNAKPEDDTKPADDTKPVRQSLKPSPKGSNPFGENTNIPAFLLKSMS